MSEEIGYHKGSIEVLLNEKKELSRILAIVDALLERHIAALEAAGVDVRAFIEELKKKQEERMQSLERKMKEEEEEIESGFVDFEKQLREQEDNPPE